MLDGFLWTDLLVLAVLGLLIFGPKRLPEIGSSVGSALRELRNGLREGSSPDSNAMTNAMTNTMTNTSPGTPAAPDENTAHAESAERGTTDATRHVETGPPV